MKKENAHLERHNPLSWDKFPGHGKLGMFPNDSAFFKSACEIRQNPDIYEVFKNIYGEEKLWTSFDRFGVLRPTKNIPLVKLKSTINKPEWKSQPARLHFDMNPWYYVRHQQTGQVKEVDELDVDFISENNDNYDQPNRVQGLITFGDTPIQNGGFCSVLGFEKRLQQWTQENSDIENRYAYKHFVPIPGDDTLYKEIRYIGVRAGCMIVWRNTQPHSNFPNNGADFRYCQYVKMFPVPKLRTPGEIKHFQDIITANLPHDFTLSELGKKLFRMSPWE